MNINMALEEIRGLLRENAVVYMDTIDNVMTILDYEGEPCVDMDYEGALEYFTELMFTKDVFIRYTQVKTKEEFENKLKSVQDYIQQGDYIAVVGV
jgi:hypothetical protein